MAAPTSRAKNDQKNLANTEPSTHGTSDSRGAVIVTAGMGEKARIASGWSLERPFTDSISRHWQKTIRSSNPLKVLEMTR
jgi:hypothetical protein